MKTKLASVVLLTGAALVLGACGSKPKTISVGSKNTTEQMILGEILAAHLEKQLPGIQIERKFGLGGPLVLQGALQSGAVDVCAEDSATMLGAILKEEVPGEPAIGLERAQNQYQTLYQFAVLKPLGFHHQFVTVGREDSKSLVKADTLSGVSDAGKALKLGVAYDLFDRKDAFTALTTKYRLSMRELPLRMDATAMYEALGSNTIDLAAGYSTDSWTNQAGFKVLKDDRELFSAHPVCVIVRNRAAEAAAGLRPALEALSGVIQDEAMRKMNQDVDLHHRQPAVVAREFLTSKGL